MVFAAARKKRLAPWTGPGLNCHSQLLPVNLSNAIGITWFRVDDGGTPLTPEFVDAAIANYGADNILWLVTQFGGNENPVGDAALVASRGITNIECGNEVFGEWWAPHPAFLYPEYRDFCMAIREAVGPDITLYGMGHLPPEVERVHALGSCLDVYSIHPYNIDPAISAGYLDSLGVSTGKSAIVTEVGSWTVSQSAAVDYYLSAYSAMGSRAWCYYDGPDTDARGLFHWNGSAWVPTGTYNGILAGLSS